MAKGKRSKGTAYTSKGERRNVSKATTKAVRRELLGGDRVVNQITAHRKGKNTMVTIPNPNKNETNKRFIRVPGTQVFGPHFVDRYIIKDRG